MPQTPILDTFLGEISVILRTRDGLKLQQYLQIEPVFSPIYLSLISELRDSYSRQDGQNLETKCNQLLPEARDESNPWNAFIKFMADYFSFIRDVNVEDLLETYNRLEELVQKCNGALGHFSLGIIMLQTVVSYSRVLARLAIGLDEHPELLPVQASINDESGIDETLPERAANVMRQIFNTCLNDRSSSSAKEGKKVAVYKITNLCLKVLFQCNKVESAEQIFANIDNQSPPLSGYPRSEQVTYLYYLGCFHFNYSHFHRACVTLQHAFNLCPPRYLKQRRLILSKLVASNIILGRFPSARLYQLPEANDFRPNFEPICQAVRSGNLAFFNSVLDWQTPISKWLARRMMHIPLKYRCEIHVWRSLIRKVFIHDGYQGESGSSKAPTVNLKAVLAISRFYLSRDTGTDTSGLVVSDKELAHRTLRLPLKPVEAMIEIHPEFIGMPNLQVGDPLPDLLEVESIVSSLIIQDLLKGFISHKQSKFAIRGAKEKGALLAGFPNIWQTVTGRQDILQVPGWKKEEPTDQTQRLSNFPKVGPGTVIKLKGARPAGASP